VRFESKCIKEEQNVNCSIQDICELKGDDDNENNAKAADKLTPQQFTMQQRSKKTSVGAQREFLRVSKVTDADVMDLRRSTYDAELQFEKMRKMNK